MKYFGCLHNFIRIIEFYVFLKKIFLLIQKTVVKDPITLIIRSYSLRYIIGAFLTKNNLIVGLNIFYN
jgi:hypothetical protein